MDLTGLRFQTETLPKLLIERLAREEALEAEVAGERQFRQIAEARVEAAAPAVAFHETLVATPETWGLQQAGKALGQRPNGFVQWLLGRGDLYRRAGSLCGRQHLIDRGILAVRWEEHGGRPRPVTHVTGAGIALYARLLGVQAPPQGRLPGL